MLLLISYYKSQCDDSIRSQKQFSIWALNQCDPFFWDTLYVYCYVLLLLKIKSKHDINKYVFSISILLRSAKLNWYKNLKSNPSARGFLIKWTLLENRETSVYFLDLMNLIWLPFEVDLWSFLRAGSNISHWYMRAAVSLGLTDVVVCPVWKPRNSSSKTSWWPLGREQTQQHEYGGECFNIWF